jgi:hypothetical protein
MARLRCTKAYQGPFDRIAAERLAAQIEQQQAQAGLRASAKVKRRPRSKDKYDVYWCE